MIFLVPIRYWRISCVLFIPLLSKIVNFFSIPCLMDLLIDVYSKHFCNLKKIATYAHLIQNSTFLPKSVSFLSFFCLEGPNFTQSGPLMTFDVHKKLWVPKLTSTSKRSVFIIFFKKLLVYFLSRFLRKISPRQLSWFDSRFQL